MKSITLIALCIFSSCYFIACTPKKSEKSTAEVQEQSSTSSVKYKLEMAWATDSVLKTPESVLYDAVRKVIYVSNVNQNPWEKDGNGFISKLSSTGEVMELEWVTGMSGPKGMALVGSILYVADLDALISIDVDKGEIIDKLQIDGASGMNDITLGGDGNIYFSDSNEGKIFQYANKAVSIFQADAPGRPNGLLMDKGKLLVAFSQTSEFVSYEVNTLEKAVIATGIGAGDGITPTDEPNTYLVSDWNGEIFIIDQNGNKQSLLQTKDQGKNTADIWFIQEKNLVLVPTFFDNRVVAYKLVKE